ncbi:epimerase [Sphingobacterium suaedae]|uniref:Epimerase n=1 Tax=Sphingobacterium suaedae TaxID=1686402 RepID=A0ABW5KQK4_9SPHI
MKKVVLAGGSGNLGRLLIPSFVEKGYRVVVLSRSIHNSDQLSVDYVQWDGEHAGAWSTVLEGADVLINLSGESVNTRFTAENKKRLEDSRLLPTKALGRAIKGLVNPPISWINFSGISLFQDSYGMHDEQSTRYGSGFLADLTRHWEDVFGTIPAPLTKKIVLRLSPVLMKSSGIFAELYPLAKWGLGGKVGSGEQFISWIHAADFVRIIHFLIDQKQATRSFYHACSPNPVTNAVFMKELRQSAGMYFGLPLPTLLAQMGAVVKGVDPSLVFGSTEATTKYLLDDGFEFKYAYIHDAFRQLIKST